jgi:predicted nucleic acid-binding protein
MIYFDTAYLAKCYLNEHGSDEVRKLATQTGRIACCEFGRLELAATIHRNLREGKITRAQNRLILDQFDSDEANHVWTWLPVTPELLAGATARFRLLKPSISPAPSSMASRKSAPTTAISWPQPPPSKSKPATSSYKISDLTFPVSRIPRTCKAFMKPMTYDHP